MTLRQRRASLLWLGACSPPAALAAAALALVHEGRQLSSSTVSVLSLAPGPVSLKTSSSTPTALETTTMPPTSTNSEQSLSQSSSAPASPLTASSNTLSQLPGTSSHSSSALKTLSTPSPSGTTSATPQASSSPAVPDFAVHNMTTCTSGSISWVYNGTSAELLLSIFNIGVDQSDVLSGIKARQTFNGTIQQQLANTSTSASPWLWPSVNITQGWYEIQGRVLSTPSVSSNSARFFIANGTDVTCLTGASATVTSSSPSSSSLNTAAIAGGVVGGIVGIALVIIAGVCLWARRKRGYVGGGGGSGGGGGGGGRRGQKWGSLKSADSNIESEENGTQLTGRGFHAHSESTAGVLEDVAHGSTMTTPGGSDEDAVTMGEEKLVSPASSSRMNFDVLKTPVHDDRRTSACDSIQIPSPISSESPRSRFASVQTSGLTIEQQTQRIRSSMEVSVRRRSERLSMPTLPSPGLARLPHSPTHAQRKEEYPLSPVAAPPVNRSVSTSAVSVMRRTSRKPVPLYDPSVLLEDTNADSVSMSTAGADSSHSHGTGNGAGVSGMQTDLVHKASFGDGRPMHYLIPDMPPPQED